MHKIHKHDKLLLFFVLFVHLCGNFEIPIRSLRLRLLWGLVGKLVEIIHKVHLREKRRSVKKPGGNRLIDDEIVEPACFAHGIGAKVGGALLKAGKPTRVRDFPETAIFNLGG